MIERNQQTHPLTDPDSLEVFFKKCNQREHGTEPNWEEHKRLILEGFQAGKNHDFR